LEIRASIKFTIPVRQTQAKEKNGRKKDKDERRKREKK